MIAEPTPPPTVIPITTMLNQYIQAGFVLVPIPHGTKGPKSIGWNQRENCLTNSLALPDGYGVGLAHAYSGTMALDIDDWESAKTLLSQKGIDLESLMNAPDAVTIDSGVRGHGKLIYSTPFGITLPSKKINFNGNTSYELRCATSNGLTVQDLIPPSIHPITNQPYQWGGLGNWQRLPTIPMSLLTLWRSLIDDSQPKPSTPATTTTTLEEITSALDCVPADCSRDEWLDIGMGLHHYGYTNKCNDEMFDIWNNWSATATTKYKGVKDLNTCWKSFKARDDGITIASLYHIATKNGYKRPATDGSKLFSPTLPSTDNELIKHLASLKPIEYDRLRIEQAKLLGVQVKTLDRLVKEEREACEQDNSPFADIEPWHEAIAPTQLLDDITQAIQRFIVLDKHQAQAAALWVSACWFVNEIQCAPIALINAPERACGKTQLLTVLGKLAPRTAQASGISPSVLFRMIEAYQPTLFIDEIETILKDNEDLRGLINAGHTRDSAYVWRSVTKGDDFEPKRFSVWGMKAIAGINAIKLAETVTSRAIVFELRRKRSDENVERLRQAEAGLFETLARKLARFSEDYSRQIKEARPNLPNELGDRDQDNWEPLLQVASVAGGHWLDTATNAALKLSGAMQAPMSTANELLADIQEIFDTKQVIKISTNDLINALCEDSEKSWATYNRGNRLSPRQLSNKLKDYGITSKTLRMNSYGTAKGYELEQFNDAFTRYLADPLNLPSQSNNSPKANNDKGFDVTNKKTVTVTAIKRVTPEPAPVMACDSVTDKTPIFEGASASVFKFNGDY